MRNQGAVFTSDEQQGYTLYKQKCSTCHAEPLFTDNSFRNNGINPSGLNDEGRYLVTLNTTDKYKFKVPNLRNLYYTSPYMHDGRFFDLQGVLDHYTSQVQNTPNLDPVLQQGSQLGIAMTADEKLKILAFLNTLNDRVFVTDKRFSEQ
jgi:cytochrome c peroxidase